MTHHTCSVCKQEAERRHKYSRNGVSFLACDACLAKILYQPKAKRSLFGIFKSAWTWLKETIAGKTAKTTQKANRQTFNAKTRAKMASAKFKSRTVPANPAGTAPQVR